MKRILHMQIWAPFCFNGGRHLERSFAAPKLLAGHCVCLWRYAPISMWRWIIFFIFVDVWSFLSLARGSIRRISISEANVKGSIVWSWFRDFQRDRHRSMMLPTLLRSAAQRTIERWRAGRGGGRFVRVVCPQRPKAVNQEWFLWVWLIQQLGGTLGTFCQRKRKGKSSKLERPLADMHGAGCVTTFSVTQSRSHAGQSEAPPSGGLAWACME